MAGDRTTSRPAAADPFSLAALRERQIARLVRDTDRAFECTACGVLLASPALHFVVMRIECTAGVERFRDVTPKPPEASP